PATVATTPTTAATSATSAIFHATSHSRSWLHHWPTHLQLSFRLCVEYHHRLIGMASDSPLGSRPTPKVENFETACWWTLNGLRCAKKGSCTRSSLTDCTNRTMRSKLARMSAGRASSSARTPASEKDERKRLGTGESGENGRRA